MKLLNLLSNLTTVIFLLILAYGIYSDWSFRDIAALSILGFAVLVLLETIFPDPEPE